MSHVPAPDGAEICGVVNSVYGHTCEREAGHDGPHIEFADNKTIAWGGLLADRTPLEP